MTGLLFLLIAVAAIALWLYAFVDILKTKDGEFRLGTQLIWVLVVLIVPFFGPILYLALGRPNTH